MQKDSKKNERESLRRLDHKIACNKLFSLIVSLLKFEQPKVKLTVEQTLKFIMACIIRWILFDKNVVTNTEQRCDTERPLKTILIAWSEEDVDVVEYGNEFDGPTLPVGSKLFDVIIDNNGNLKNELQNVFKGLSPWKTANFGPIECEIKSQDQNKKKSKTSGALSTRILLTGAVIRGTLLDSQQEGQDNFSTEKSCKRVLQSASNNDNAALYAKRSRRGSMLQRMEGMQPTSYTARLSLSDGSFTGFCDNFSPITGIRVEDAVYRKPIEFLHPEDKCWSKFAMFLWTMGKWTKPCFYRLKTGNLLDFNEYIYIQCEILARDQRNDFMEIKSTVLSKVEGEQRILDTRKRQTKLLLDLLGQVHRNQFDQPVELSIRCDDYRTDNSTTTAVAEVNPIYPLYYQAPADVFSIIGSADSYAVPAQQQQHAINPWSNSPATTINDSGYQCSHSESMSYPSDQSYYAEPAGPNADDNVSSENVDFFIQELLSLSPIPFPENE